MPAIRPRLRVRPSGRGFSAFAPAAKASDRLADAAADPRQSRQPFGAPLRARGNRGAGAPGRGAARLHPGRCGLRPRLGLVGAGRQARLHPALPRAEPGQQPDALLQLVLRQRHPARDGRGGLDRQYDRGGEEGARGRPEAHLRHRAQRGRGDGCGDARHLSRAVRRRRDHRRRRLWLRLRRRRRVRLHGRAGAERRAGAGRKGAPRLAAQGALAARADLAGQRRSHGGREQCRRDRAAMGASARPGAEARPRGRGGGPSAPRLARPRRRCR